MKLSANDWRNYVDKLRKVNEAAAQKMEEYINAHGIDDTDALVEYAYAVATKYGEANGALACEMYDAVADASEAAVPPAEMAPTATFDETARAIYGTILNQNNTIPQTVSRLTKQVGADTTLRNALRDGAKFAWVPHGTETCAFCITLASRGWQNISKKALKNGHAEHIHANCQCEYAISFDANPSVGGYDPDYYYKIYADADGNTPHQKINAIRREIYAEQKDKAPDVTSVNIPVFTPAKNISEAEEFAKQFTNGSSYSKVDYSGIDLEYANEFNRALNDVLSQYDPKYKLNKITFMNMREKVWKGSTADAAYRWGSNDLYYNKGYYKSTKEYNKHLNQYSKLQKEVLPNVDILLKKKKNATSFIDKKQVNYLNALKNTGRANVSGGEAYGTIVHEMGHYLDDTVFRQKYKETGFDLSNSFQKYSQRVSGYATSSHEEYVAESFLAYWKGETETLDPELVSIFEGARK